MAQAPLSQCTYAGCRQLIRGAARCEKHQSQKHTRGKSASYQHLYGRQWRKASTRHKQDNPLCVECLAKGKTEAVYCTDHIVPHQGDKELFWNKRNWQSLCETCHNSKTARGE